MDKKCKCDKCGCEDVAITVQYRKANILRVVNFLLIIAIFLTTIFNMGEIVLYEVLDKISQQNIVNTVQTAMPMKTTGDTQAFAVADTYVIGPIIIFLVILLVICKIAQYWIESKKRVYYVCKNCGQIWHNYDDEEVFL